jgi:hypothetical protein
MLTRKKCGTKLLWLISRHSPRSCSQWLRKITETPVPDRHCLMRVRSSTAVGFLPDRWTSEQAESAAEQTDTGTISKEIAIPRFRIISSLHFHVVVHVDRMRVGLRLWSAVTSGPIVHPPGGIWLLRSTVEWLDRRNPKNSEKSLFQCHFVDHKSHMNRLGREPAPTRQEAGD